jgi:hypothetical protein
MRLRRAKPNVFGADDHGFQMGRPLSEADAIAFEQLHRVILPEDYRRFLTCVGNGGAGPFYGIFALGKMDDNFDLQEWHEEDGMVGVLSEPFPLEEEWNDLSAMPEEGLLGSDESEYNRQMEAFDRVYWNTSLVNGALPICHEGCALRIWLVVTGAQAGYLWEDKRSEYGGLVPVRTADGSSATFTSWYDEWMNACLATKQTCKSVQY